MASMASTLQKLARHHIPLIRFKYGANQSGSAVHASNDSKSNESNTTKTVGASSQSKAGTKSAPLEFNQTPTKYRRRPLTQAEIDLVTIGGST